MNNFYGDYHVHTKYSDGKDSLLEVLKEAKKKDLKEIAISDHSYSNPSCLALNKRKHLAQLEEIKQLEKSFEGIRIIRGIEANILDEKGTFDMTQEDIDRVELILLGFHRWAYNFKHYFRTKRFTLYNGFVAKMFKLKPSAKRVERNTSSFIKIIETYPIDILAHINDYAKVDYIRLLRCAQSTAPLLRLI